MQELRCKKCEKLLARRTGPEEVIIDGFQYATYEDCIVSEIPGDILGAITKTKEIDKDTTQIEIKCPRCKIINNIIV